MKAIHLFIKLVTIILLFLIIACNPTGKLHKNEYLLKKNVIKIDKKNFNINKNDIKGFIQQKPNKRLLGIFYFKLWVYNITSKGEKTKFKSWLSRNFGEKPAILDSSLAKNSIEQINLYLENKGCFNSDIYKSISLNTKKQKAKIYYYINPTKPYTIKNIDYQIDDKLIKNYIFSDKENPLLKTGDNYDVSKLDDERERITSVLRNNGYYDFSKEYIYYKIESSLNSKQMNIIINITKEKIHSGETPDEFTEIDHKRYDINKIYINPDYDYFRSDTIVYDTLIETIHSIYTDRPSNSYYFTFNNELKIKPKTLTQSIFIN